MTPASVDAQSVPANWFVRLLRSRPRSAVAFLLLQILGMLTLAGGHGGAVQYGLGIPLAVLSALFGYCVFLAPASVTDASLTPPVPPARRRPNVLGFLGSFAGLVLVLALAFATPFALATLWISAVGDVHPATVTRSAYLGSCAGGRCQHRIGYALITDTGQSVPFDVLTSADLGYLRVGDRALLRIDPTGLTKPEGELRHQQGHYRRTVWIAGGSALLLLAGRAALAWDMRRRAKISLDAG
ncbi:hypothetical protein SAMN05444157_3346 [Frankineae bacterium MT45]|nr:hypothetical protein SAMN05444157_3346 [Frankineae bacterium MT45]